MVRTIIRWTNALAALRGPAGWLVPLLAVGIFCSSCVTPQERGDRAFETAQYQEALDRYEEAIEQGARDPQLYYRAAESAVKVGDFALAERYYSRALRYGGGEEIARSLAEFYISTSNYTKAVRVLQELLEDADQPQPLFNNLGAALMYAGAPLDAEAYLLIAQQMDPSDPVPYLNLGVLYDRYLNQSNRALGFYRCFLQMGEGGRQQQQIRAKVQRLQSHYSEADLERFRVECGEPYEGPARVSKEALEARLAQLREDDKGESEGAERGDADDAGEGGDEDDAQLDRERDEAGDAEEEASEDEGEQPEASEETEGGGDEEDESEIRIERPADEDLELETDAFEDDGEAGGVGGALARASEAYEEEDYEEVVRHMQDVPVSELDADAMVMYGRALVEVEEFDRAQRWLAGAVEEEPTAYNVAALVDLYQRTDQDEKIVELCERFEGYEHLDKVLSACPEGQLLRQLQKQQ